MDEGIGEVVKGCTVLGLFDCHFKWLEVQQIFSANVEKILDELQRLFANHGFPEEVVSDNGPQFVSFQFAGSHLDT